ncbi:MAG TPA: serine/threonine-protein kinase [Thermoanaerobaculia bacterium]|jgi:serine/threonine protein kinase
MISDATVARLRSVAQQPDLTGTPYTIVREIARGGMSIVYEAVDARLDRRIALKVLALELSSSEAARRMKYEARTIARLEHPGIVPIHDIGELPDGRVFYTMKLVRGMTLGEFARNRPRADLLRLFLRICDAIAFAHAAGIVHRDLKPENIMVGEFGEVLVMDWGVAASIDATGEIAGTHGFMAPEQLRGEPVNRRADIFALGAILQLVASGDRPLCAISEKAMANDPGQRYGDVSALAADVARYLDAQAVSAYRENVAERVVRWTRRNAALVAVVTAYIVMRVIVFFWLGR